MLRVYLILPLALIARYRGALRGEAVILIYSAETRGLASSHKLERKGTSQMALTLRRISAICPVSAIPSLLLLAIYKVQRPPKAIGVSCSIFGVSMHFRAVNNPKRRNARKTDPAMDPVFV